MYTSYASQITSPGRVNSIWTAGIMQKGLFLTDWEKTFCAYNMKPFSPLPQYIHKIFQDKNLTRRFFCLLSWITVRNSSWNIACGKNKFCVFTTVITLSVSNFRLWVFFYFLFWCKEMHNTIVNSSLAQIVTLKIWFVHPFFQ